MYTFCTLTENKLLSRKIVCFCSLLPHLREFLFLVCFTTIVEGLPPPSVWKTTAIRLTAVRETGIMGPHLRALPETPRTSQHYRIQGFKGIHMIAETRHPLGQLYI